MMQNAPLVWGELAVTDMDRATAFYNEHFGCQFRREDNAECQYAVLECEDKQAASIGLIKHPMAKPSMDGSVIYLHFADKLGPLVARLEQAKVEILMPPMGIKEGECGYIALFADSEGNRVGLWCPAL
ncbi:VOC family protein [Shewanella sedimentimangrovi]|uniref:VOC family protein n=1 Tax=Shewanella sedimentimangrovi TaxID=2814293 RepID=A0ABX7R3Z6_9GAMM|nr:VOC family protein [Shewanella sedimentimangrovi]QSX38439.1 VOC family protein [Shewanella sedimentimangrovi]